MSQAPMSKQRWRIKIFVWFFLRELTLEIDGKNLFTFKKYNTILMTYNYSANVFIFLGRALYLTRIKRDLLYCFYLVLHVKIIFLSWTGQQNVMQTFFRYPFSTGRSAALCTGLENFPAFARLCKQAYRWPTFPHFCSVLESHKLTLFFF